MNGLSRVLAYEVQILTQTLSSLVLMVKLFNTLYICFLFWKMGAKVISTL